MIKSLIKSRKIVLLFGLTGVLFFILREISRHSSIDINVHDTYLVISSYHVSMIVFFLFQIFAFIYYVFEKRNMPLGKRLTYFHYGLTTLTIGLFFILSYFMIDLPLRITPEDGVMNSMKIINLLITISTILFVLAQLLFLVNIGRTLFKKKN